MKQLIALLALVALGVTVVGCAAGGDVDEKAIQQQADKEKALNKQAEQKLPPGEGPAG